MDKKIRVNEFLFGIGYIILFIALFLDDIAFRRDVSLIVKMLKALSICVLIFITINKEWGKSFFKEFIVSLLIGFIILICSGDFFFFIVILLGYNSSKIKDESIYKLAYYSCFIFLMFTLGLYLIGILPDVLSYRTDFSVEARHSFGFIHSTVLPLILCYMLSYYIAIKKEKTKVSTVLVFLFFGIVAYMYCKSRNAFAGILVIAFIALILKNKFIRKNLKVLFKFIAKWITLVCIIISVVSGILRYKGVFMPIWYAYDRVFTNRSLLASSAIESYGIHLINNMSYLEYSSLGVYVDSYIHHGLVLDNAYMYILIRYGILILIFTYMVLFSFYKEQKENVYTCVTFIVVIILNMTDNDMLSYGCLPFLLIGIKNIWNKVLRGR